jgi:hypothetical protein
MVRCKSTPVKRLTEEPRHDVVLEFDRESVESLSDEEDSSTPKATESTIARTKHNSSGHCGVINQIWIPIIKSGSRNDSIICLSMHRLLSSKNIPKHADVGMTSRRMVVTLRFPQKIAFHSRQLSQSAFHELTRLIKSKEVLLAVQISDSGIIYLKISVRAQKSTQLSNLSFFKTSYELYHWITRGLALSASAEQILESFSAKRLLQTVGQCSTARLAAQTESAEAEQRLRDELRVAGLLPELREYQVAGVEWMARREQGKERCTESLVDSSSHLSAAAVGADDLHQQEDEDEEWGCDGESESEDVGLDTQGWSLLPRIVQGGGYHSGLFSPVIDTIDDISASSSSYGSFSSEEIDYTVHDIVEELRFCEVWYNSVTEEGVVLHLPSFNTKEEAEANVSASASFTADEHTQYPSYLSVWRPRTSPLVCGGILADEPGLGKTVELLALILLSHHRSHHGDDEDINRKVEPSPEVTTAEIGNAPITCGNGSGSGSSVCVCMRESFSKKLHKGWVQCDVCDSYVHLTCAGVSHSIKISYPQHNNN